MGIYLNPGNDGFLRAVRSKIYVDKTGMLEYMNSALNTEQCYLCVSRPRRFGKSIAAEMLVSYYDRTCDSHALFDNLKIASYDDYTEHLNQYDVLHVDMNTFLHRQDPDTGDYATPSRAVIFFQQEVIHELAEAFPQVALNQKDLPAALADINRCTGSQFIIIIDEWDAIFREDRLDEAAQKSYITLLRGLFKDASSKKFIRLAYLTGILPIKKYGTESALNNFDEFTMENPKMLAEYVGFTEDEVRGLCGRFGMDFEEAKNWYDGYGFRHMHHVYNPNSIVKAMLAQEYDSYWTRTETYESLRNYITMNFGGLRDDIVQMLAGGRCRVNPGKFQNDMTSFRSKDDILTLLIHLGYLAYDSTARQVYIPNAEVRGQFENAIEDTGWENVIQALDASEHLLQATLHMDEAAVAAGIGAVHDANTSLLKYNDENSLSCVLTLAYYNARNEYTLIREFPSGRGFADLVFLPHKNSDKPALVVELKWDKSAEGALAQIHEKNYVQSLEGYAGDILLVGVNYDKGNKQHTCRIERYEK